MRRGLAVALLAWALVVTARAPSWAALDDEAVGARAREVLADPELQTRRPDGSAALPAPPPPEPTTTRRPHRDRDYAPPVQAPSEVSQVLIWIVVGAIAAAVVVWLATGLQGAARRRKLKATRLAPVDLPMELQALGGEQLDETLRAAMTLAAAGRFEEAVHVLLGGAIADLQARAGLATEPALTSRELQARASLPPDPRAAFHELVVAVEVSLFGGAAVTRDDFDRCARSFRLLRQAVVA